jgi:transcriptional regulator GlxA family with amidase domain
MQSLQSIDLAHALIQERLSRAAQRALAKQLVPSAARNTFGVPARVPAFARARIASALRSLAVRLDPSLDCEPRLAVVSNSR